MTTKELLSSVRAAGANHVDRVEAAFAGRSDEQLNKQTVAGEWSPYQVIEHLRLSNAPYLPLISAALDQTSSGTEDLEVRHTWFGNFLIKAAGPSGNAPAPKPLVPGVGPYDQSVVAAWKVQQAEIAKLCDRAGGKDIVRARVRNPFLKMFRMNVADCLAIFEHHTERHVRQIEERVKEGAGRVS